MAAAEGLLPDGDDELIYLKLTEQWDLRNETLFCIKKCEAIRELKEVYAERTGLEISCLRFLFDDGRGTRVIFDEETPNNLNMKTGDEVEVWWEEPDNSNEIELTVLDQHGDEIRLCIEKGSALGELKKTYTERTGLELSSICFYFDGRKILEEETPNQLRMEQRDIIEVYPTVGQD